jgi:putative ATPase
MGDFGLFEQNNPQERRDLPLATRMRPRDLYDYVGQEHVLGAGTPMRKAVEEGQVGSVVLWAPPGVGKTTLAYIIAERVGAHVEAKSAVSAGVADIRKVAEAARTRRNFDGKQTLLILDEIHHFTRNQQDSLLGYLEDGTFMLVGCTTENPFFTLAPALLSRARVLPLKSLSDEDLAKLVDRSLTEEERGLGSRQLSLEEDASRFLLQMANGDARLALNALESASLLAPTGSAITVELLEQVLQRPAIRYDQQGDYHYDTISAFIKSVRGSDADAALHYLARMIVAGEDPRFIARRLVILASEDIGNAEPQGLVLATSAAQAVERIGMPEARIVLGQVTAFLAEAPKSNRAYLAIDKAIADVEGKSVPPIPMHLRNAPATGMKELGHGEGYQYPHDSPDAYVAKRYLPEEGEFGTPYYNPSDRGYEKRIQERRERRPKQD